MFEAFIEALLMEAIFNNWLEAITTKPTPLTQQHDYRVWAKGIFVARLEAILEARS